MMIAFIKLFNAVQRSIVTRNGWGYIIHVEDEPVDCREVVIERRADVQTESVVVSYENAYPSSQMDDDDEVRYENILTELT